MNIHIKRLNKELAEFTGQLAIAIITLGLALALWAFGALVYYSSRGEM